MQPNIRTIAAASLAATLVAGQATADGFAQPIMEPEVIVEDVATTSAGGIIVPLLLLAIIAAVASGGGGGAPIGPA